MSFFSKNSVSPQIKICLVFTLLLLLSSFLIYFGSRNDATSIAKSLKVGVLTADKVNVSFEQVGGKLLKRQVVESDIIKKGDVLMVLDDVDTVLNIKKMELQILSQEALISQEQLSIQVDKEDIDLQEITSWKNIEELLAKLTAARVSEQLSLSEYNRILKLNNTGHVSQSQLDNTTNNLKQAQLETVKSERQLQIAMQGATETQKQQLYKTKSANGMTLQSILNKRNSLNNRQNLLAQYQSQLEYYKVELSQLRINLQRLTLYAPESGKILNLLYETGEVIPKGATSVLIETERKYIDIYVNETIVHNFQPGTIVKAFVPALNRYIQGTVRFANPASSFSDLRVSREKGQADLTSYQIRIYFTDAPLLLSGMTIEVIHE